MVCYNCSMEGTIDFKRYVDLFNKGIPIKRLKPLKNQTYKVFANSNADIRVIDREKCLKEIAYCSQIKYFTADSKNASHRFIYALPIQSPNGTYVGFIYRTMFDKNYSSVFKPFKDFSKKVPYMYGFHRDFHDYDRHTTCMPIVVCEGIKDALMFKHIYPYVLSCNTSSLGLNAHVIANITDKVILAYDNDSTGYDSTKKDKRTLTSLGCSVDVLKYDDGFKDVSDYVDHPQELRAIQQQLKDRIDGLVYGYTLAV